jgi:ABC-type uncharacterized transport system substrate-binding protein
MTELGYRERQKVRYQYYNSKGNEELLRTIAHKLVHDRVDLIVTSSTTATVAAARATQGKPIPVVFLGRLFERGKLSETFQELFWLW